ncbi:MAG: flavodoxin family protein [Spirochaetia bacterium]
MIVGIHSGRRGKISESALRYVLEHTGEEYKVFALTDLPLETCDACLGCLATNRCVKDDGVNEIADELCKASALVFAAPEYWEGVHGKARAFWERVCFMGRHNSAFPLRHLDGVIIGVAGHGDASAAIRNLSAFFEDARIRTVDTVDVQGSYACFECGFAQACEVAGVWDIFPRDTEVLPEIVPSLFNQDPHLCKRESRSDIRLRLEEAAEKLSSEIDST